MSLPDIRELLKHKSPVLTRAQVRELYETYSFPSLMDRKGRTLSFNKHLVPPPPPRQEGDPLSVRNPDEVVSYPLWLIREWARKKLEVYPEDTELLKTLNVAFPWMAAHISLKDPSRVAYTPDAASGERDIQVVLSLEKLLSRAYTYLPDHEIAAMAADHKAELDPTLEILTGDELVEVYDNAEGVAACMSKPLNEYTYPVRPTIAYKAENISMAVVRNPLTGVVTARAMLYCPTPEDRRYIRVYGSELLKKKLERAGFKPGTWHGAKFNTVKVGDNRYAAPYLDGNGVMADGARTSAVALLDGTMTSISAEMYHALRGRLGSSYAVALTSTSGYCALLNINTADFIKVCPVSGESYNTLEEGTLKVWFNNEYVESLERVVKNWPTAYVVVSGESRLVSVAPDLPTFNYSYSTWIDNTATREYCKMVKLSEKYYPQECSEWMPSADLRKTVDGWIKKDDSIHIINADLYPEPWHKSVYDKKLHTLVHNTNRTVFKKLYALSTLEIVKLIGSTKVVVGSHDIVKDIYGNWQWTRKMELTEVLGESYYASTYSELAAFKQKLYIEHVCKDFSFGGLVTVLHNIGYYPRSSTGGRYTTTSDGTLETLRQYCAGLSMPGLDTIYKRYDMMLVEANAVDYNLVVEATPLPIGVQNEQTS